MKIHLAQRMVGAYGIQLIGTACTNNPFIKGRSVSLDEFLKLKPEHRCKRCETSYKKSKFAKEYEEFLRKNQNGKFGSIH